MKKSLICAVAVCFAGFCGCGLLAGAEEDAYSNLTIHRQVLQDTDCICGVIYLGYVDGSVGSLAEDVDEREQLLEESGYTEDFTFLKSIDSDHVVETDGGSELYCIYPLDEDADVTVYEYILNESNGYAGEAGELLYHDAFGEPFLLRCNVSDIMSDSQISIVDSVGRELVWEPAISLNDGSVNVPWSAPFVYDATYPSENDSSYVPESGGNGDVTEISGSPEDHDPDSGNVDWNSESGLRAMRVVNCNEWVSLRERPDVNSERLEKIPLGAVVTECYPYSETFTVGVYNGKMGYILSEYLTYDSSSAEKQDIWNADSSFVSATMPYEPLLSSGEVILDKTFGLHQIVAVRAAESDEVLRVCCYDGNQDALWGYTTYVGYVTELNATDVFLEGSAREPWLLIYNSEIGLFLVNARTGDRIWDLYTEELSLGGGLSYVSDDDGTLYLTGYYADDLVAVSASGQILWRADPGNPEIYWPYQIRLEDGDVIVDYDSGNETGHFVVGYRTDGTRDWTEIRS